MNWDLLVKGGLVVDPSQRLHEVADVAVSGSTVAAVERNLDPTLARQVVDAEGLLVTPGFIDIHVHTFASSGRPPSVPADPTSLANGVTTILDAGSATPRQFPFYREIDIRRDRVRTFALLRIPDPAGPEPTTVGETCEIYRRHEDVLVGIKFHHSQGYPSLVVAREAADFAGGLLMAEAYGPPIPHLLEYLKPGDVVTHSFHPAFRTSPFDDKGKVFPAVWEAIERGIYFDIGFGARGFGWRAMEQAMEQGLYPHTISTDLHQANIDGPVYDMPHTMSKFLALGFSLDQVIEMSTSVPAKVLRRDRDLGSLRPGAVADITVSELVEGDFTYIDVLHEERRGRQKIVSKVVISRGEIYEGPAYKPAPMTHRVAAPPGYVQAAAPVPSEV